MSFTREQIQENNERLRIESLALAALSPEERRRHMDAKRAGNKSPVVMDEFKRLGLLTEPTNDHPTCSKIPDAEQCERPKELAGGGAGEAQGARCPHVRFTLCRVRLLDIDAKWHSCKDLLDGLQYAGLIPGDKEGQITLQVDQVRVSKFKDERTEIEIDL